MGRLNHSCRVCPIFVPEITRWSSSVWKTAKWWWLGRAAIKIRFLDTFLEPRRSFGQHARDVRRDQDQKAMRRGLKNYFVFGFCSSYFFWRWNKWHEIWRVVRNWQNCLVLRFPLFYHAAVSPKNTKNSSPTLALTSSLTICWGHHSKQFFPPRNTKLRRGK